MHPLIMTIPQNPLSNKNKYYNDDAPSLSYKHAVYLKLGTGEYHVLVYLSSFSKFQLILQQYQICLILLVLHASMLFNTLYGYWFLTAT